MKVSVFKKAFTATLPVMAGYIALGIGLGVILGNAGFGLPWSLGESVFIYAGSMQYLSVELMAGGASLVTVALTTLMVNCRHLFYGVSMVDKYKNMGLKKPYLIFALTDETYSLVCHNNGEISEDEEGLYYLFVSALDHLYWITGCVLGSVLGSLITFNTEGIDFVLTALFVTIVTDQWINSEDHAPALTGLIAPVICLLIFGRDSFLIPSMILIVASLFALKGLRKDGEEDG